MKKMHENTAAKNTAGKKGLPVKSNVKAGDFWDSLRSMSSSTYNTLTGALNGGSSDTSSAAASGASGK
ncbi:hypothetical protein GCAAIG_05175 [Candidatus Electronema halotolerans]|jgi:hypothetical protein